MKLKLIADIHISPLTVRALQKKGYDIGRITDKLAATATDKEIIQLAHQEKAVIITQDLDFSAIIAQSGHNGPSGGQVQHISRGQAALRPALRQDQISA